MSRLLTAAPLRGIIPPLVTPLAEDEELDRAALERLVEHVVGAGARGLFVLGTTGEGPSLSYRLRGEVVKAACQFSAGRAPVLVGVTDTSLAEAIDMAHVAAAAGADAVVFAPPCYFPIDQADLLKAVRRLARESSLPVMLYNMPALTKTFFAPETVQILLEEQKLIGLKDSSGDLTYFRKLREVLNRRPEWSLLAGPEHLLAETVAIGGDGGVCGGANVFPELFVRLFDAAAEDSAAEVLRLQKYVARLGDLYRLGANPALAVIQGIKAALASRGDCSATLCPPFSPLGDEHMEGVAAILRDVARALSPSVSTARASS